MERLSGLQAAATVKKSFLNIYSQNIRLRETLQPNALEFKTLPSEYCAWHLKNQQQNNDNATGNKVNERHNFLFTSSLWFNAVYMLVCWFFMSKHMHLLFLPHLSFDNSNSKYLKRKTLPRIDRANYKIKLANEINSRLLAFICTLAPLKRSLVKPIYCFVCVINLSWVWIFPR